MLSIEILRPYSRNGSFPIDTTSLFYSYDEAVKYAATDPSAYVGQIIAVNDVLLKQTAVYKVDYNASDTNEKSLTEISVGANGSAFSLKGTMPTYADLIAYGNTYKTYITSGYMYYVEADETNSGNPSLYVSVKGNDGTVTWKKIDVSVQLNKIYADRTNDGIIRHQLFNTFIDSHDNTTDSVYYSKAGTKVSTDGTPNNSWLKIEKSSEEATSGSISSLVTSKKVVELINKTASISPDFIVETTTDKELFCDDTLQPSFTFKYYPHAHGVIKDLSVTVSANGSKTIIASAIVPETEYHEDADYYSFTWTQELANTISQSTKFPLIYIFTLNYGQSDDGLYAAGSLTKEISFYFYGKTTYTLSGLGNYSKATTVKAIDGNEFTIEINPTILATTETIHSLAIDFPENFSAEWIEYVPQQDYNALNMFSTVQYDNKIRYILSAAATGNVDTDGFKSIVSFKVKQKAA